MRATGGLGEGGLHLAHRMWRVFRAWRWGNVVVALVASGALAATGASISLGGFSAAVTDNANAAGSGTLLLQEGVGSTICLSTGTGTTPSTAISSNDNATCPASLFSSTNLEPGGTTASATVVLKNPGSLAGSVLSLTPGTCTATDNTSPGGLSNTYFGTDAAGFCGKLDVTIENDTGTTTACVFPTASTSPCPAPSAAGTLAGLVSETLPGLAAGGQATYTVVVGLDSSATNADQGLLATVPLTWTLNQ